MAGKPRKSTTTRPARKTTTIPPGAKHPTDRLGKMPRIRTVTVPMDDQAVRDLEAAQAERDRARDLLINDRDRRVAQIITSRRAQNAGPDGQAVAIGLDQVRAEVDTAIGDEVATFDKAVTAAAERVDATSRTFTFHSIGNRAYQDLLKAHAPTDDDHEQVKAEGRGTRAGYHAETFAPALIQACCDELSADDVAEIFDGDAWNLAEIATLFMAAYEVNTQRSAATR